MKEIIGSKVFNNKKMSLPMALGSKHTRRRGSDGLVENAPPSRRWYHRFR